MSGRAQDVLNEWKRGRPDTSDAWDIIVLLDDIDPLGRRMDVEKLAAENERLRALVERAVKAVDQWLTDAREARDE